MKRPSSRNAQGMLTYREVERQIKINAWDVTLEARVFFLFHSNGLIHSHTSSHRKLPCIIALAE